MLSLTPFSSAPAPAPAPGDAWRETWREAIGFDASNGQPMVERSAHKWAKNALVRWLREAGSGRHGG